MYVAKCVNRDYMRRKLGTPIAKWEKCLVGFMLMLLVLILLAGPILLFSAINPISVSMPTSGGRLEFKIGISNLTSSVSTEIPLFFTDQLTQLR